MTITIKGNISPMGLGFNTIILPPIWILGNNPPTVFPLPDATQGSSYNSGQIKADPTTTFAENVGFNTKLSDLGLSLSFTKSTSSGPGNSTPGYYVISGTPTVTNDTPYTITVVANNSGKTNSKNFSLLINPAIPVWTTDSIPEAYETLLYTSDKMNATYAQSFLQVVNTGDTDLTAIGLTLTSNIGYCSIDGTPTTTGTYNVTVRATNRGQNAEKSFSLVIDYATPLWVTDTLPNITQGSLYSSGNVIARSSQSYSEISGGTSLSSLGLTLNDHTTYCEIVGTPLTTGGPYNINLRATNHGKNADKTFTINVDPAAPIWTTDSITPIAEYGQAYTSDHLNATYATSFSSITDLSVLGLTLTSHAGYCVLTGPNTMAVGAYPITLRATNGTQHTDKQFTFTVDSGVPVWTSNSMPDGSMNDQGTINPYDSGHLNATYATSFSIITGSGLTNPSSIGLTFESHSGYCTIIGTPTTSVGNPFSIKIRASNLSGDVDKIFTLSIPLYTPSLDTNPTSFLNHLNHYPFQDSSSHNYSMTPLNIEESISFSKFGSKCARFIGGEGTSLSCTNNALIRNIGQDFTIDFWLWGNITLNYGSNALLAYFYSTIQIKNGSTTLITTSVNYSTWQWRHIAIVRSGSTLTIYNDGTRVGSTTFNVNISNAIRIGYSDNGYVDEFCVSNVARWTDNFTPDNSPNASDSTKILLLHFDDINSNGSVVDSSSNDLTVTGNALIVPNPVFGNSCALFYNWSSVTLTGPSINFGTGNFTVDFWVYKSEEKTNITSSLFAIANYTGTLLTDNVNWTDIFDFGTYNWRPILVQSNTTRITSSIAIIPNTWTHLSLTRNGNVFTIWVNGESAGNWNSSVNLVNGECFIGRNKWSSNDKGFKGLLSELRVSNVARWTSNFSTPTDVYYSDANTILLLHFNSSNNPIPLRWMLPSTPSTTPSTKFNSTGIWLGTGNIMASDLFNNSDGKIPGHWFQFVTDFTIDFWIYPTNNTGIINIYFSNRSTYTSTSNEFKITSVNNTGALIVTDGGTKVGSASATPALNQWNHIAVVRYGTVLTTYINGVAIFKNNNNTKYYSDGGLQIGPGDFFMTELRVLNDSAAWTDDFTPPTDPY